MLARRLLAALLFVSLMPPAGGRARVTADIGPDPGSGLSVSNELRVEWGPLTGQMARPATAGPGETWESFAVREAGDARWAPIIRAMNGGGEKPDAGAGRTWVPPRDRAFDGSSRWFSVYVDSSKFGPDSDISRSGFDRVDPDVAAIHVFGTVTLIALEHAAIEDAARSFAITQAKPRDVLARRIAPRLLVTSSPDLEGAAPAYSPARHVEHTWRVEELTADSWRVSMFRMEQIFRDGGSVGWPAVFIGLVLAVVFAVLVIRRMRAPKTSDS